MLAARGTSVTNNHTSLVDATVLVVVRDILVGQDLAQTISEARPEARVIVVTSLEDAVAALADVQAVALTFIAAEPEALTASPLAQALADRGAKVVLMGTWADQRSVVKSWKRLPLPFTSEHVRDVIAAG